MDMRPRTRPHTVKDAISYHPWARAIVDGDDFRVRGERGEAVGHRVLAIGAAIGAAHGHGGRCTARRYFRGSAPVGSA